ncbi:MAG: hypothetical protein KDE08_09135 [Rhodobacteraceae bacterium]|nr:hypothetical protein [Paracoccaceae bacterium]
MTDIVTKLSALNRPGILVRAAREGVIGYSRGRDLRRLMRAATPPSPEHALGELLEQEERVEEDRRSGNANYSVTRHIDILIAVLAEAALLRRPDTA